MNMKTRMAARVAALMGMVTDGNKKYQDMIDRMNNPDEFVARPRANSHRKYWPNTPNPARRATKTLNGTIFHRSEPRGYEFGHKRVAPHIDEVRDLERKHSIKIHVRDGIMYGRNSSLQIKDFLADVMAIQTCESDRS